MTMGSACPVWTKVDVILNFVGYFENDEKKRYESKAKFHIWLNVCEMDIFNLSLMVSDITYIPC